MIDYIVNQTTQYGVEAENPNEAVKKVIAGEGVEIAVTYSGQPRPRAATSSGVQGVPSPAAQKLAEQQKKDANT